MLHSGKGIAGRVFKTGKSILIPNVKTDLEANDLFNYPIIVSEQLQSVCAVPLWRDGRVAGVMLVGFREENRLSDSLIINYQQAIEPSFGPFFTRELVDE
ncbi:hypothetical protein D3C78_1683390 [compost metagenome]